MILIPLSILLFFALLWLGLNLFVCASGSNCLYTLEEAENVPYADAILILGAGVRQDHTPSNMLEDRLLAGFQLYESGVSERIIVSGDHGRAEYDEVNVMKDYLVSLGVPSDAVFMDHAGFSTYDSLYRAKEIFGAESLCLVTQKYHAYRALFIGKSLGLDCSGVAAPILSGNFNRYSRQTWFSFRESLARCKDFFLCLFKPEPKFLGEPISLEAGGQATDDRPRHDPEIYGKA